MGMGSGLGVLGRAWLWLVQCPAALCSALQPHAVPCNPMQCLALTYLIAGGTVQCPAAPSVQYLAVLCNAWL